MLFRIQVSDSNGIAYAEAVTSARPDIFGKYSLWPGRPAVTVTTTKGHEETYRPYEVVKDPPILAHLAGPFYKILLNQEQLSTLPHTVQRPRPDPFPVPVPDSVPRSPFPFLIPFPVPVPDSVPVPVPVPVPDADRITGKKV